MRGTLHTIANDFVARLALDVAGYLSVLPTATSVRWEYTMQILLRTHLSQAPDRINLYDELLASLEFRAVGTTYCFTGRAPAHDSFFSV